MDCSCVSGPWLGNPLARHQPPESLSSVQSGLSVKSKACVAAAPGPETCVFCGKVSGPFLSVEGTHSTGRLYRDLLRTRFTYSGDPST
ncbi:hypothetical protein AVEN_9951-1 [Araneus ventricosus]|uniref:Uncharacterized protein n=1 Tax=Araneus ventricosus TaxID=182803 RepID=A0A4Y2S804_ARAVE|nr:hypothetical protein AVEN_9951-1 [Araneus ventricosus]